MGFSLSPYLSALDQYRQALGPILESRSDKSSDDENLSKTLIKIICLRKSEASLERISFF